MVAIANSIPKDVAERSFIAQAEKLILTLPQLAINPVHRFSDGLYIREQSFPKDSVALGFEHVGECLNIVLFGRGMIFVDGHVRHIVGPAVFTSGPGVQKVGRFLENTVWINVHPNPDNGQDIDAIEARIYRKSESHLAREAAKKEHIT